MHEDTIDPAAVGLADYGKPGHYIERQVARWTLQYRAAETERIEAADALIDLGAPLWQRPAGLPPFSAVVLAAGPVPDLEFGEPYDPVTFLAATPISANEAAWARLASELPRAALESITRVIALDEAIGQAQSLMDGKVRGRIAVRTA